VTLSHIGRERLSVFLALGVLLLYGFSTTFGFMPLDDAAFILENPHVNTGLTPQNAAWAFRLSTIADTCYYMPVTWLTFMADATVGGLQPSIYHLVNVLLFALTAVLLLRFFLQVTRDARISLVAAALFCLHPMRVESVVWVAERKDLLSGVFLLTSLLCWTHYLEERRPGCYAAAVGAFFLGFLSKPNIVVLPVLLVITERLRAYFREEPPPGLVQSLRDKIPFFALAAAGSVFTLVTRAGIMIDMPLRARLAVMAQAHYHYLSKTLLPWGLMLGDLTNQLREIRPPFPLFVLVALTGCTLLLVALRKRHPWALLAWLWFLVALAPTNGFLSVGNGLWSDKFTYVPHMGLMLGVSVFLDRLLTGPRWRRMAVGGVLCLYAAATLAYAWQWRSAEDYFHYVIGSGGPVGYSQLMIATARSSRGDLDGAIAALDEAQRRDPGYVPAYFLRGRLLEDKGLIPQAMRDYEQALRLDPKYSDAMVNLGLLYARTGNLQRAEQLLGEAGAAAAGARAARR
jgi:protein O-mannosyl-transferase